MCLPAPVALPIIYGLCDEWLARRQTLAALGVQDPDLLDTILGQAVAAGRPTDRSARAAQVAAFVAATGGDTG